jgi:hypothetical protein
MKTVRGAIAGPLFQQVSLLRQLDGILRDCLPAECCDHCRAARLDAGTLHLVTDSAAWRARLHFYSARIIRHFNRIDKFPLQRVRVRVGRVTPSEPAPPARPGPAPIPPDTARAFATLAGEVDDPGLRRALERLAARGPKPD